MLLIDIIIIMKPQDISSYLLDEQQQLINLYKNGGERLWSFQPEGKWTGGQHMVHLVQSTEPLLKALRYPKFVLKWKFGTNNRENRTIDQIISRYKEKLADIPGGVVSPFSANMPKPTYSESEKWINQWQQLNSSLNAKTLNLTDKDLDSVLIPHPLMGRMTLREILMWNAYHASHHYEILKEKYTI